MPVNNIGSVEQTISIDYNARRLQSNLQENEKLEKKAAMLAEERREFYSQDDLETENIQNRRQNLKQLLEINQFETELKESIIKQQIKEQLENSRAAVAQISTENSVATADTKITAEEGLGIQRSN